MESNEGNQLFGRIYKITSSETDGVYVGSTTRTLRSRFANHIYDYHGYLRGERHYTKSCEVVKFPDAQIELLHEGLFESTADLFRLEGEYIQTTENCINRCVAGRTPIEWRRDNTDKVKEYQKTARTNNKNRQSIIDELIDKDDDQEIDERKKTKAEYDNQYRAANRERKIAADRAYRENNKERIHELKNKKITCDVCGVQYTNCHKAEHIRSIRHIKALSSSSSVSVD